MRIVREPGAIANGLRLEFAFRHAKSEAVHGTGVPAERRSLFAPVEMTDLVEKHLFDGEPVVDAAVAGDADVGW
jgi:hypothetical protein